MDPRLSDEWLHYWVETDCLRNDPEMQEERRKSQVELLKEELKLQKEVNGDAQQRAELAYLDAKKIASQYQKEAEKCNLVRPYFFHTMWLSHHTIFIWCATLTIHDL